MDGPALTVSSVVERDLVIVGGGAAGLTAGLYAARARLDAVLIDQMGASGGQLVNIDRVENYPGFPAGIAGAELGPLLAGQAMDAGLTIEFGQVTSLARRANGRYVVDGDAGPIAARSVILAMGSTLARLGVEGEAEFEGRGVSYCATCDGMFVRGQPAVVVGGGDSAMDEAHYLAALAASVTVVHRRDAFRAERLAAQRVLDDPRCRVIWNSTVVRIEGGSGVDAVVVESSADGTRSTLEARGVFVYTGLAPATAWLDALVQRDGGGHISVDANLETTASGIFAAGDLRQASARQLASAVGDGATAALNAERFIRGARAR